MMEQIRMNRYKFRALLTHFVEDDDERDEDLRRLEFVPVVNMVCLFPMDDGND